MPLSNRPGPTRARVGPDPRGLKVGYFTIVCIVFYQGKAHSLAHAAAMRLPAVLLILAMFASPTRAFDFDDDEEDSAGSGQPSYFADDAGLSVVLQHAFGDEAPQARGKLTFKPSKGTEQSGGKVAIRVAQVKLEGAAVDAVKELAQKGGLYTVMLPSVLSDPESPPVFASTSACALLASRFEEHMVLIMDGKDRVAALSYTLPVVPPRCPTDGLPRLALDEVLFNTKATQHFPEEGPNPLGKIHDAAFLPPAAAAAAAKAARASNSEGKDGEEPPPENQSFLRKYWMYILPVVILLTMGGGEPPAEGGAGGGAASGGGGAGGGGGARPAARAARR